MLASLRLAAAALLLAGSAYAADYPAPKQGDYVAHDFRFHDGRVMKDLRLHYATVGDKSGEPVLVLHGTAGSGASMLDAGFAGVLFGPGQPLDARKYYIIVPDVIGAGKSSKPSDGLRASFPQYNYDDMIAAQYELLTKGLGVKHLRLVIGNSMGGMETWLWGELHPDFVDALVPMASQPSAMASRNWMMRRLIVDSVRKDPEWDGGNYKQQPKLLRYANVWFGIATNGGTLHYAAVAPTTAAANKLLDGRLAAPFKADANDFMYQWDASRDYDAVPALGKITAYVLAINSADDERNPPQTGLEERDLKRVKHAEYDLIPASTETRGHGTTAMAKFYAARLRDFLAAVPKNGM